jgi:hypothetical protein
MSPSRCATMERVDRVEYGGISSLDVGAKVSA